MPPLTDDDIDALIETLDRHNKLGVLKGKSHQERVKAFRDEAGRELLVAMIQATSGQRFKDRVYEEYSDLKGLQRTLYGVVCLVNSQRYTLDREELLLATGDATNETLDALEKLVQRHLVVRDDVHSGYRARHRVIADEVVNQMRRNLDVGPALEGVCFAFSTRSRRDLPYSARPWRRLARFINHDFMLRMTTADAGRTIYSRIEDLLDYDYHYWLQRGSLEVEEGDLEYARQFLDQARSLAPDNLAVDTEYAYLLIKKAGKYPDALESNEWFAEGQGYLEQVITANGKDDYYPYHVLGSQGLSYARHAKLPLLERRSLLRHLLEVVREGVGHHPRREELIELEKDIERRYLLTAVPEASP